MQTSTANRGRPRPARTALALALTLGLVAAVVLVRDGASTTAADLDRISDSVAQGCVEESSDLGATTGFALDGTVLDVTPPVDSGAPVLVELAVAEWFRGPPLDRWRVRLDARTVRSLRDAGEPLAPGVRLLVSGRGWGEGGDAPAASGCGRTRLHDPGTADDWRARLPPPAGVGPHGPVARYPGARSLSTAPDQAPGLTGVLLHDRGCLYVDDGVTRWVPVFPAAAVGWTDRPPQLRIGADVVDVGHAVRLGGLPATGVPRRGVRSLQAVETRSARLDPGGVPEGCRADAPRFVVSDPPEQGPADVVMVADDDPLVQAVLDGAVVAGLAPTEVAGQVRRDAFGEASVRVAVQTRRAGEVLVHVETVPYLAWPHAYAPSDATFRWGLDPEQASGLPRAAQGAQLAVVERADGTTQLLVRTGPRVVVSVSADPEAVPGDPPAGRELLDALASVASGIGGIGAGRPLVVPPG